jgi:hypothetical protein
MLRILFPHIAMTLALVVNIFEAVNVLQELQSHEGGGAGEFFHFLFAAVFS